MQIAGLVNSARVIYGIQVAGLTNALSGIKGIQISGIGNSSSQDPTTPTGLQIGAIGNLNFDNNMLFGDFSGISIGGVGNISRQTNGLQLGGLGNVTKYANGFQIGGGNIAEDLRGAQIGAFLWNYTNGFHGAQFGPLNLSGGADILPDFLLSRSQCLYLTTRKVPDEVHINTGIQIGVVNASKDLRGVQIGLFNYCRRLRGLQLGVLNIINTPGRISPVLVGLNFGWQAEINHN